MCHHNSVLVRQVVATRGINCDPICPLCKSQEETILHLLRDCPFAATFWRAIKTPQLLSRLSHLDLLEWLKKNYLCSNQQQANGLPWSIQFLFAIWGLWKHRNIVVFENTPLNPCLHKTCIQQAMEYYVMFGNSFYFLFSKTFFLGI